MDGLGELHRGCLLPRAKVGAAAGWPAEGIADWHRPPGETLVRLCWRRGRRGQAGRSRLGVLPAAGSGMRWRRCTELSALLIAWGATSMDRCWATVRGSSRYLGRCNEANGFGEIDRGSPACRVETGAAAGSPAERSADGHRPLVDVLLRLQGRGGCRGHAGRYRRVETLAGAVGRPVVLPRRSGSAMRTAAVPVDCVPAHCNLHDLPRPLVERALSRSGR